MDEKKTYNVTGTIQNVTAYEERFRKQWTKRATEKNDRIVGAGYAERQIAATLEKVEPIDMDLTKLETDQDELVKRGDVIERIALELGGPEHKNRYEKFIARIISDVPGVKLRRGQWIRDTPFSFMCTNCHNFAEHRFGFCPNCGADMRAKK